MRGGEWGLGDFMNELCRELLGNGLGEWMLDLEVR